MIAYACIARDERGIRLALNDKDHPCLWLGHAAFDLTQSEFDEIADKLGIRINRDEAPQS